MLRFLKMMVAEDVTTITVVAEDVILTEETETSLQDVKADLEVIEILLETEVHAKADHVTEVLEATEILLQEEKVALEALLQEVKVVLTEHQDVQKTLETAQDQEDQEEINNSIS
ncbi:hypothetical protein D3C80_1724080 [compost metagenome]